MTELARLELVAVKDRNGYLTHFARTKRSAEILCGGIVKQYYSLPKDVETVDFVVHDRKVGNSYEVELTGGGLKFWDIKHYQLDYVYEHTFWALDSLVKSRFRRLIGKRVFVTIEI